MRLKNARWKARTDLGWLCRNVLGYPDVSDRIHGPIIKLLQRFPLPPPHVRGTIDELGSGGKWIYKPWIPMYELENVGRRRLILDPRSWLKCHGINNLAILNNGQYISVSALVPGQKILGIDEHLRPQWTTVKGVAYQGIKPTIKLRFRTGRTIEVTPNHPVRLLSGWVLAENLKVGDRVPLIGNVHPPFARTNLPWAELMGWLLGDGSMSNANVSNTNPLFVEKIIASATRCGFGASIGYKKGKPDRVRLRGIRPLLRNLGLEDKTAGTKFIPPEIFKASLSSLKDFLYGFYMSDGTLTKYGAFLTTKSRMLADGLQRLLLRINVLSTIKTINLKTGPYSGNEYYSVAITGPDQIERFLAFIPWDKQSSWSPNRKVKRSNYNTVPKEWRDKFGKYLFQYGSRPQSLPTNKSHRKYDISKNKLAKYAGALDDEDLMYLSTDALYWDTLIDIGPVIHQPTWDIETESGTLSTNDLITHNTTINAQAHTIQWIINYPDVTIQIIQSNTEKAELILGEIKSHFQKNPVFRELFPEHCPQKRVDDWGTKGQFISEARRIQRRESTVMTGAIDKGSAGLHFDVMKFSDIVEPSNVKTDEQIHSVKKTYYMMENLLVRPDSWIDVEGTRYAYADLYGDLLEKRKWLIHARSCYKRVDPDTKLSQTTFVPDTLKWPFEKDGDGKFISWWPDRFPYDLLEEKRNDDSFIFSTQQLNDPSGDEKEQSFPVNEEYPKKITRKNFTENVRVAYREIIIDTAETISVRSNFTVLTVIAVDSGGRVYVEDIRRGKFMPDQWIDILLQLLKTYKPTRVKIEETSYVRGLRPYLERIQAIKELYIPFEFVPTDNQRSKPDKIRDTLQPYYKTGDLRFLEDLTEWPALTKELQQFPFGVTDDILDTLADHFRTRDWFGRERTRPTKSQHQQDVMDHWIYGELYGAVGIKQETNESSNTAYARTGGM